MAVIEIEGLRKQYRQLRGERTVALDGLDLFVPEGGVFGFLGPNGSGKTTTIRCLLGLVSPTAGSSPPPGADPMARGGPGGAARRGGPPAASPPAVARLPAPTKHPPLWRRDGARSSCRACSWARFSRSGTGWPSCHAVDASRLGRWQRSSREAARPR